MNKRMKKCTEKEEQLTTYTVLIFEDTAKSLFSFFHTLFRYGFF